VTFTVNIQLPLSSKLALMEYFRRPDGGESVHAIPLMSV
jgi:hypothetical protein